MSYWFSKMYFEETHTETDVDVENDNLKHGVSITSDFIKPLAIENRVMDVLVEE